MAFSECLIILLALISPTKRYRPSSPDCTPSSCQNEMCFSSVCVSGRLAMIWSNTASFSEAFRNNSFEGESIPSSKNTFQISKGRRHSENRRIPSHIRSSKPIPKMYRYLLLAFAFSTNHFVRSSPLIIWRSNCVLTQIHPQNSQDNTE